MEPIYTPQNTRPAYQLEWGVTLFWRQPTTLDARWLAALQESTEPDGVRVLKHRFISNTASQFFVSTKPPVAPPQIVRSVKGRLQHILRPQIPKAFQRNYCLRSIGSAKRSVVEDYVAKQLGRHPMADPKVQQRLAKYQKVYPEVDLSKPCFTAHGEYFYNLHLVLVNAQRWMEIREDVLDRICQMIEGAAAQKAHRLARLAIVPDHIHLLMGCPWKQSPEEIALGYLNNCAYACGMKPVYKYGYYTGTIGEYDQGAVV
jgi:REP element-mobilizing transposase RayT